MARNEWNVSEKQLEDAFCKTLHKWLGPDTEIIGRQIQLPHGILDVLAYDGEQIFVIELKACKLKEKDIGQVLRYTYDVQCYLRQSLLEAEGLSMTYLPFYNKERGFDTPTFKTEIEAKTYKYIWHKHGWGTDESEVDPVVPVLIGTSFDESIDAATEAAGVLALTWAFDSDKAQFIEGSEDSIKTMPLCIYDKVPNWARKLHNRIEQDCKADIAEWFIDTSYICCN